MSSARPTLAAVAATVTENLMQRLTLADRRAYRIADEAAVADIEMSAASWRDAAGVLWYDTRPMLDAREHSPECLCMAQAALDHAAERGLIERRLSEPHMVRIKLDRLTRGALAA